MNEEDDSNLEEFLCSIAQQFHEKQGEGYYQLRVLMLQIWLEINGATRQQTFRHKPERIVLDRLSKGRRRHKVRYSRKMPNIYWFK